MEIRSAKYLISSPSIDKCPEPDRPEFAFIGRSNVGKSSLINLLTGSPKLAKTSGTPGKTQLINHFTIESVATQKDGSVKQGTPKDNWYMVDLPGYGYAKRSKTQRETWTRMISHYLRERSNLITVFVLIDSRHKPQTADIEFLDALASWQVACNFIFTKTDKSAQRIVAENMKQLKSLLKQSWQFLPQSFATSTVKGTGRREILGFIGEQILPQQEAEE